MPLMPESPTASKSKTNLYILLLHLEERGGGRRRRRGILNHVGDVRKEVKSLVSTYHF